MVNPRKIRNVEEARWALDAVARSGCGRVAWAHANNIDARSLNAWRVNLARVPRAPLHLVELVADVEPPAYVPSNAGCRIFLRDFVVEVDAGFEEETLLRVLGVVRGC